MSDWNKDKIKVAFDRFIAEHGRLPTALEVDKTEYLPSARHLQRRFGGLRALREQMGYQETDFGKGEHRSTLAKTNSIRGLEAEKELESSLIRYFGEAFVHTQKYYGDGKNRADFIVYTATTIFGVDVFTTETQHDLETNVNLKLKKYRDYPKNIPLFFVVVSTKLSRNAIKLAGTGIEKNKKQPNLTITDPIGLLKSVKDFTPYPLPTGFESIKSQRLFPYRIKRTS